MPFNLPNCAAMTPTVELRAKNTGKTKTGVVVLEALWAVYILLQTEGPLIGDWPPQYSTSEELYIDMTHDIVDCSVDGTEKFNGTQEMFSGWSENPTGTLSLAPGSNLSCVAGAHHNFGIPYLPPGVVEILSYPDNGGPGYRPQQLPRFPNTTLVIPRSPHLTIKIHAARCKPTSMTGRGIWEHLQTHSSGFHTRHACIFTWAIVLSCRLPSFLSRWSGDCQLGQRPNGL